MNSMFNGCSALKLLDISRFNLEKITDAGNMFSGINNINENINDIYYINFYINLNYVKDPKGYITKSDINKDGITVCRKEKIITNSHENKCCYYDLGNRQCEIDNYITMFFGNKAIYKSGFVKEEFNEHNQFIINGENHNKILSGSDRIYLHRGSKLEVYFHDLSNFESFNNYFRADKDKNMKNLVSLYLSNLKIEHLNNINSLFYECESLKSIVGLNEIITESIHDMSYLFYNCKSLEFIDLSSFDSSNVQSMKSMFDGCESLKYLDISQFNFENDPNIELMFNNVSNLKYINVYNVKDPNKLLSSIDLHSSIVCQKEKYKIILNSDITKCCYYDIKDDSCEDSNFITI